MDRVRLVLVAVCSVYFGTLALSCHERDAESAMAVTRDATELLASAHRLAWDAYHEEAARDYAAAAAELGRLHDSPGEVRALIGLGVQLRESGAYDSSLVVLDQAFAKSNRLIPPSTRLTTDVMQELGSTQIRLSRYKDAVAQFEDVVRRRAIETPLDSTEIGRAYHGLGWAYHEMQVTSTAIENFETAMTWYDASAYGQFERSRSLNSLGVSHKELSRYDEAIMYQSQSYTIREKLLGPDHPQVAVPLANMAVSKISSGLVAAGIEEYRRAGLVFENRFSRTHPEVARVYSNLGSFYDEYGELAQAEAYLLQALSIRQSTLPPLHRDFYHSYFELAELSLRLDKYDAAQEYIDRAGLVLDTYDNAWLYRFALVSLNAELAHARRLFPAELEYRQEALSIIDSHSHSQPDKLLSVVALAALSKSEVANNLISQSIQHARAGLRLLSESNVAGHPHQIDLLLTLTRAEIEDGRPDAARHDARSAVDAFESLSANLRTGAWQLVLGWQAYLTMGSLPHVSNAERLVSLEKANRLSIEIRKKLAGNLGKLAVVSRTHESFDRTVSLAHSQIGAGAQSAEYKHRAFRAAEQGRAGVLLDAIAEANAREYSSIPDSLLERERDLRYMLSQSASGGGPTDSDHWDDHLFETNREYTNLVDYFESEYPDYFDLKYNTSVASISDIQGVLGPDEALLEYVIADSIYLFVVRTDTSLFLATAKPDSVESLVSNLIDGITEQKYEEFTAASLAAYDVLVRPVQDFIRGKDLIVVPDAVLNYVPFEALISSTTRPDSLRDYQALPYLVKQHAVSYSYSATLFQQLRTGPRSQAKLDFLGLAPVFENDGRTTNRAFQVMDANTPNSQSVKKRAHLPGSLEEVLKIKRSFNRSYPIGTRFFGNRTRLLLRKEATEGRVKSTALDQFRFVHFATHAFANDVSPELSGLILAADNENDDGILSLAEVYNLNLDADLVVLSACETGLGKLESGEGMIGLTRGFLFAGSSNVVVSLWKADDVATRNLMIPFYQGILDGESMSVSLQQSKLKAIGVSRYHARPYFWAQFILNGR